MKKILLIFSTATLLFLLSACRNNAIQLSDTNSSVQTGIPAQDSNRTVSEVLPTTKVDNDKTPVPTTTEIPEVDQTGSVTPSESLQEGETQENETKEENRPEENRPEEEKPETVDVDLTVLSSIMVYSEVYNMMVQPEDYIGKRIKMSGTFFSYLYEETGETYYNCLIADATACCSQGLEFVLKDEDGYPVYSPEQSLLITVTGVFQTYEEDGYTYYHLIDADIEY